VDNLLSSEVFNIRNSGVIEFRYGSITDDKILWELEEYVKAIDNAFEKILVTLNNKESKPKKKLNRIPN